MSDQTPSPPPGWYPNPHGDTQWWNGAEWATPPAEPGLQGKPRSGLARSALIVGIVALLIGLVPILGAVAGAAGIVLAVLALKKHQAKGWALTGLILASFAVLASATTTVLAYTIPWDEVRQNFSVDAVDSSPATSSASPEGEEQPPPQQLETPVEPVRPHDDGVDQAMVAQGWEVYESGNIYVQFADPADFTCGYANCTFVHVVVIDGCPNTLYVEASLMQGETVIGMTNDMLGAVSPEGTATAHLEDFAGNADTYLLTKVNCY